MKVSFWLLLPDGSISGCMLNGPLGWHAFEAAMQVAGALGALAAWCEGDWS